jgi:hypothetical protein
VQWGTLMTKKACSKVILDFHYSYNAYNVPKHNLGASAHLLCFVYHRRIYLYPPLILLTMYSDVMRLHNVTLFLTWLPLPNESAYSLIM